MNAPSDAVAPPDALRRRLDPPQVRRRPVLWFVIMAVLLGGLGYGLWFFNNFRDHAIQQFFASMKPPPTPVTVATATAAPLPVRLPGIGDLVAVHQVVVTPQVGGLVTKVLFESGQSVKAGDPLVQLDDRTEQADLASFRAQARLAEVNLARSRALAQRQNGPLAQVDQDQAALDQAHAGIAKDEALIAQKLVRAPFTGDLGVRQVEVGQYLNAGAAIATLTDLGKLYVNFTLPEGQRSQLALGQSIDVTVDAYPGTVFQAKLTTIDPQVNADTRTIKLQATLDNPKHRLQPGMFANAAVVLPSLPDVVMLPETAVDYTLYGDSVFVVQPDKDADGKPKVDDKGKPVLKVVRQAVQTGAHLDNKVAILKGVAAGDRVVAVGQLKLQNNMAVAISESPAPTPSATPPLN